MPAFSSGQWAGTLPATLGVVPSGDFLFMAGGGILAHPGGPAAGVKSLRQAWEATRDGKSLADAAHDAPELARSARLLRTLSRRVERVVQVRLVRRRLHRRERHAGNLRPGRPARDAVLRRAHRRAVPAARAARRVRHCRRRALDGARCDACRARSRVAPFLAASRVRACCTTNAARPSTARRTSAASASRSIAARLAPDHPVLIVGGQPSLGRYCVSASSLPSRSAAARCFASTVTRR